MTSIKRSSPAAVSDYEGRHIRIEDGRLLFPPIQKPHPPLYFGGSSDAGIAVAAETIDKYLTWGEPPAQVAEKLEAAQKVALSKGRSFTFGIRLHVIVRETNEAAWRAADNLLKHLDDATLASAQKDLRAHWTRSARSACSRSMAAAATSSKSCPNLWAGVGLVRGGAGTASSAIPKRLLSASRNTCALASDTFIFSGYPHLEEAYRFAEARLPACCRSPTKSRS